MSPKEAKMEGRAWRPWAWALGGAIVVMIIDVLVMTRGAFFPVGAAVGMALLLGAAALGGLAEARNAPASPGPAWAPETARQMLRPLVPFSVNVVETEGACPLGYRTGDVWAVGQGGQLSRPLCLPAILAARRLTSSWTEQVAEPTPGRLAACRCPWAKAALIFEARALQAV